MNYCQEDCDVFDRNKNVSIVEYGHNSLEVFVECGWNVMYIWVIIIVTLLKCMSIEQPHIGLGQIIMNVFNNDCLKQFVSNLLATLSENELRDLCDRVMI